MLPPDIQNALQEQRDAVVHLQGDESLQLITDEIEHLEDRIAGCTSRYQRREKLDLQTECEKLLQKRKDARSGKLLKDFDDKMKPMLDMYRRLEHRTKKDAPVQLRLHGDSELVLEIRRNVVEKYRKTDVQRAIIGDFCDDCGVIMLVIASDSLLGCPKCAKTRSVPHASATSTIESDFVPNGTIKVKSRLLEWVQFCQAKESLEVDMDSASQVSKILLEQNVHLSYLDSPETRQILLDEIDVNGPFLDATDAIDRTRLSLPNLETDLKSISGSIVKRAMQALVSEGHSQFRKLYESSPKYASFVSGFWPRRFTALQEERIRRMFTVAAPVYHSDRVKSATLTFKGGYPYWLRCICVLNGWYEFLDHFPIKKELPSSERETKRFEFWSKLKWEFVPSHAPFRPQECLVDGKEFVIHADDFEHDTYLEEDEYVGEKRKRTEI